MSNSNYKLVTYEELLALSDKVKAETDRKSILDIAQKGWGPNVHHVVTNIEMEYNDEGGYDPRLTDYTVYDKDDEELEPDFTLPCWLDSVTKNYESWVKYSPHKMKQNNISMETLWNDLKAHEDGLLEYINDDGQLPDSEGTWYVDKVLFDQQFYIQVPYTED